MNFIYLSGCMLLLAYCTKPYVDFIPDARHDKGKEKEFTLKSMRYYFTNTTGEFNLIIYNFHFNKKRQLDSILMDPQVIGAHTIFRSKNRIDSVVETFFGSYQYRFRLVVRSGFEYDKHGNFTRFNTALVLGSSRQRVDITYEKGHVHSVTHYNLSNPSLTTYDTFTYFKNDIVRWSALLPGSTPDTRHYTYDRHHYNPLYFFADDLLAVFSGSRSEWEFFLGSEHVTTSKFYEQSQQLVKYENYYDRKGRLIKKVFIEPSFTKPDSLTFEYVK